MASRNFGAWRLAATIAAHHWLLTAGISTRSNSSNGTSACSSAWLTIVEHAAAQIGEPLLLERRCRHCRLELAVSHAAPPAVARQRTPSHRALRDRQGWSYGSQRKTDVECDAPSARRAAPDSPNRTPHRPGQRHDDGIDLVEHALRHAAQRQRCTRTDRVSSIFVGERGDRVVVDPHVLAAPLPHGPTSSTTTAP